MSTSRLERKLTLRTSRLEGRICHADLVQVAPERSKVHLIVVAVFEDLAVDRVVVVAVTGLNTRGSEVFEGTAVHGRRCCEANAAVVVAKGAYGVGDIVCAADLNDVRGPKVLVSSEFDA
jgi:hypothetical protein